MKKTKKIIALISSAALMLTGTLSVVHAEEATDIVNSDYTEYVSTLKSFDYSKEQVMSIFVDIFGNDEFVFDTYGENCVLKDIYLQFEDSVGYFILEYETEDSARVFADVSFTWDCFYYGIENNADDDKAFFEKTSYDEINNELAENGFDSYIEAYQRCYTKVGFNNFLNSTSEDKINRFIFLYNNYGFIPKNYIGSSFDFTLQDDFIRYYDNNVTFVPKEQPYVEPADKYESYYIDNDAYRKYLNGLGDRLNQDFVDTTGFDHIYKLNDKDFKYEIENQKMVYAYSRVAYELKDKVNGINYSYFNDGEIYWNEISCYKTAVKNKIEIDKINQFLTENNLRAEIIGSEDYEYCYSYSVAYDVEVTLPEIMDICVKLNDEYGIRPACSSQELFNPYCDFNLTWEEACNTNIDEMQKKEETEATDAVPKTVILTELTEADKWNGGDFSKTVELGNFEKDFGEFEAIMYKGKAIDSVNYTVSQNGNESVTLTISEAYMNTLSDEKNYFRLVFEKVAIDPAFAVSVADSSEAKEPTEAIAGDSNGDNILSVRDCSFIALKIAQNVTDEIPQTADFNKDGKVNVRDAAAIASYLAKGK